MTQRGQVLQWYKTTAVLFFSTCALFVLLNVVLGIGFAIWDRGPGSKEAGGEPRYNPAKGRFEVYNVGKGRYEALLTGQKWHADANLIKLYPGLTSSSVNLLLTETWNRPFEYDPFLELREREFRGVYVNVDSNGFRKSRNQGPWPPARANLNIFLLGGSTAFGYGVPDDQTIASYLQDTLTKQTGRPVRVYNFARGFYYSTQERILFSRLLADGFVPDAVVFVDGLNDFFHYDDQPIFADLLSRYVNSSTELARLPVIDSFRKTVQESREWEWLNRLPFVRLGREIRLAASRSAGPPPVAKGGAKDPQLRLEPYQVEKKGAPAYNNQAVLTRVIERYARNKRMIEAMAAEFGVAALFVWQPVPTYRYDLKYDRLGAKGFYRHNYSIHGYPLMARYVAEHAMGPDFLWCADMQDGLKKPLYVDRVHYTAEMSKMIAQAIAGPLAGRLEAQKSPTRGSENITDNTRHDRQAQKR